MAHIAKQKVFEVLDAKGKAQNALLEASQEISSIKTKVSSVEEKVAQAEAKVTEALHTIKTQ